MAPETKKERDQFFDRLAALLQNTVADLGPDLIQDPNLAAILSSRLGSQLEAQLNAPPRQPPPADLGLAQLAGIGQQAATTLDIARVPDGVQPFEETITSERLMAVGDLYYIMQHELIGAFRAVLKLQELFQAGTVRLSSGEGALRLYQYDRRKVLRFTQRERHQGYLRAFGYGNATPVPGATPNRDFHHLFTNFNNRAAIFWRDKRISEVVRPNASDPSYGSIAIVRRAGLDLRHNLKHFSYGHLNVMRVELLQLLEEAFKILGAEDIMHLYGVDNPWDTIEEVYLRYFKKAAVNVSARSGMAINGRNILRWLSQPHIIETDRAQFEALLLDIAEDCEEWLTSAESVGAARFLRPEPTANVIATGTRTYPARAAESDFELVGQG
ncbi:MAG: hypothetical protein KBG73_07935 [Candidatus Promineofilum sp.]|nr:hypothetical protein [Promineifilum sp.]